MFPLPLLNVLPNACVSTFAPIVIAGLGYSPIGVLVMSIPSGVTNMVVVLGMGFVQEVSLAHSLTTSLMFSNPSDSVSIFSGGGMFAPSVTPSLYFRQ